MMSQSPGRFSWAVLSLVAGLASACAAADAPAVIFDTDLGNDCDDVLAMSLLHALADRGECRVAAVTVTKSHRLAAPFADCVNTFHGRGVVPIGVCGGDVTPHRGRFLGLAAEEIDGRPRYRHDLNPGAAPPAVEVLRRTLAGEPDGSVVICQVGFSTNMVELLRSPPDAISPLSGEALVTKKVRLLSVMAGTFGEVDDYHRRGPLGTHVEYNVWKDVASARYLAEHWPTAILWSGYEVGFALPYPHTSIEEDFDYVADHPTAAAYVRYKPPPHDRPTWDLTSVLAAVRPEAGFFELSPPGWVTVTDHAETVFTPAEGGRDRYLIVPEGGADRVTEAMRLLASQPPAGGTR